MKNLVVLFLLFFLSVTSKNVNAQSDLPKGKVYLVEFTNGKGKFAVPQGKSWYIYNIFSDRKYYPLGEDKEAFVIVALKSINKVVYDNAPYVYNQYLGTVINFPLIFPEKTTFEFIIKNSGAKAMMSYIEVDN